MIRESNLAKKATVCNTSKITAPSSHYTSYQVEISNSGNIKISKLAWTVRISMLTIIFYFLIYRFYYGFMFNDPFIVYSTMIPGISILILIGTWLWYKSPSEGSKRSKIGSELISVIIPIYNQKNMIELVIDSVYRSSYPNIQVIAVNDGSIDGTTDILEGLKEKYRTLQVIHQKRAGKRKAIAAGFFASSGKYLLYLDSDSVIDNYAITHIMKTFKTNPNVGSIVGEIRIWNENKNLITKLQDALFNISCNVNKAFESVFSSVTCCSGCSAAYRRETIQSLMTYWADKTNLKHDGMGEEIKARTNSLNIPKHKHLHTVLSLSILKQKLMNFAAQYDDADDRLLTAQSLIKWESVYVITAIAYAEAQQTWKGFIKQQIRWKKGFLRSNFYLGTYYWRGRHPYVSLVYYIDFLTILSIPFVNLLVLIYEPIIVEQFWTPLAFLGATIFIALAHGLDLKLRCRTSKMWIYMPLMKLIDTFVLSWLLFVALWSFKKNSWDTRQ